MSVAERSALSLRISVTDRCQLRCGYCMPQEGIECRPRNEIISFEDIAAIVRTLENEYTIDKIRLTGGEPLLRRNITDLIKMLHAMNMPDLALTTNGQLLAEMADELRKAGLQRINVSLDTLDAERYRVLTRGGDLQKTLDGVDAALDAGLHPVKLNTVMQSKSVLDEAGALLKFALERGCELRFLEIMPIGHAREKHSCGFVSAEELRQRLADDFSLVLLGRESGSSAVRYRVADEHSGCSGVVGFIAPCSAPFCADCHRLRLTTDGRLLGCLARGEGIPVRGIIGKPDELLAKVRQAMGDKRHDKEFRRPDCMASIGG